LTDKILIAGVGNIFLGDDAFGVEVVGRLRQCALPENVRLVDFGIRSYDLAYALMEDWELVVLVDVVARGQRPGTLYTIEPEIPDESGGLTLDAHAMNPVSVFQLVQALGGRIGRVLIVGCEPEATQAEEDGKIGLSAAVNASVDRAVQLIEELVMRSRTPANAA
jgi:hydrogenase maturation protease